MNRNVQNQGRNDADIHKALISEVEMLRGQVMALASIVAAMPDRNRAGKKLAKSILSGTMRPHLKTVRMLKEGNRLIDDIFETKNFLHDNGRVLKRDIQ